MATGSSSSVTTQQYPVDIASYIQSLQNQIGGLTTGQATQQNLNTLMNNPLSSDLFTGTIGPILDQLKSSEAASRTALSDQFRMAGGGQGGALQSGAFANAATQNEQNILANRSNVVANKASEVFKNLLSGLGLGLQAEQAQTDPAKLGVNLLGAIRPTSTTTQGSQSSDSGGGLSDPFGVLSSSQQSGGIPGGGNGSGGTLSGGAPYETAYSGADGGTSYMSDGTVRKGTNGATKAPQPTPTPATGATGGGGYGTIWNPQTGQWESNSQGGGVTPSPSQFTGMTTPTDQYGYTQQDWASDPYYN